MSGIRVPEEVPIWVCLKTQKHPFSERRHRGRFVPIP